MTNKDNKASASSHSSASQSIASQTLPTQPISAQINEPCPAGDRPGVPRPDNPQPDNPRPSQRRFQLFDVFLQNQAPLRRFISRFVIATQDIDDIAQEAFLRAYETEKKRHLDEPKAFLFRIARNLMLSELGKKSRKVTDYIEDFDADDIGLGGSNLEDDAASQQKVGILCEAIATLPPQCRKVFLLKKVYGMTHKEIAEYLGISVSTIEKHIIKGMRQCADVVETRYGRSPSSRETAQSEIANRAVTGEG